MKIIMLKKSVVLVISLIMLISVITSCGSKEKSESEDMSYFTMTLNDGQEKQVDVIYAFLSQCKSNGEYGEYTYAGKQGKHSYFLVQYGDYLILEHLQSLEMDSNDKISSYAKQYSYYWIKEEDYKKIQVASNGNGYYKIGSYSNYEVCKVTYELTSIPIDQELTREVVENTYKKMLAN